MGHSGQSTPDLCGGAIGCHHRHCCVAPRQLSPYPPSPPPAPTVASSDRYTFVHDGHCAGGWIKNPGVTDVDGCADACENTATCGYFAYNSGAVLCALYTLAGACPDDNQYGDYNAYKLVRAPTAAPTVAPSAAPTAAATAPAVRNLYADCWDRCGSTGGACPDFCGTEGMCCRLGWTADPSECGHGVLGVQGKGHVCVAPPPPPFPPGQAPPPPPPKSCNSVISSQSADLCDVYRSDVGLRGFNAGSDAACKAGCESDSRCKYYSFWNVGWCELSSTCDSRDQQAQYTIDIVACN